MQLQIIADFCVPHSPSVILGKPRMPPLAAARVTWRFANGELRTIAPQYVSGLTVHRTVIQYPHAASLPPGGRLMIDYATSLPPQGGLGLRMVLLVLVGEGFPLPLYRSTPHPPTRG